MNSKRIPAGRPSRSPPLPSLWRGASCRGAGSFEGRPGRERLHAGGRGVGAARGACGRSLSPPALTGRGRAVGLWATDSGTARGLGWSPSHEHCDCCWRLRISAMISLNSCRTSLNYCRASLNSCRTSLNSYRILCNLSLGSTLDLAACTRRLAMQSWFPLIPHICPKLGPVFLLECFCQMLTRCSRPRQAG
jgi:hypothetical protein